MKYAYSVLLMICILLLRPEPACTRHHSVSTSYRKGNGAKYRPKRFNRTAKANRNRRTYLWKKNKKVKLRKKRHEQWVRKTDKNDLHYREQYDGPFSTVYQMANRELQRRPKSRRKKKTPKRPRHQPHQNP